MSAWVNLFKKEFRNGLPALLFALIGLLVVLVLSVIFGWRSGHVKDALFITSLIFVFPHVFFITFYMIVSLQREKKKLHLWLHNPMPGFGLLLAKLINGLLAMTVTLFITCAVCLITFIFYRHSEFFPDVLNWSEVIRYGILIILHVYLIALDFAIWFVFFWIFYRMLIRQLGVAVSAILTIVLFGVLSYIMTRFEATSFYVAITHWGKMSFSPILNGFQYSNAGGVHTISTMFSLYFGTYFYEAVIAVIAFIISCWILDRKVEV